MGKALLIAALMLTTAEGFAGVSGGTNFAPDDLSGSLPPDEAYARWAREMEKAGKNPPAPQPPLSHGSGRATAPGK